MGLRLLCVVAHPDDECFAFGGALALAAERGVEIHLLCFTDGSAGSYRGSATTPAELGQLRRHELAASCQALGIAHHEVLDFHDGKLEHSTLHDLASEVVRRIRSIRPHVVLTFGGDGSLNTHPDHTCISAATTAAFHWAAHPKRMPALGPLFQPERLFYASTNFFLPGRPRPLPAPWTLTLDVRSVMHKKQEAFRRHTTQAPLEEQTRPIFAEHGAFEHYTLAATATPQPATQSTDMFEAIIADM